VPIEYDRNDGRWKLNHPVAQMPNLQGGWPLGWSETVLLLAAVFRFTQHSYREEMGRNIINDLEPWISRSFTNQFGSIAVNARMLAGNPKLAVERTHELISRLSKG